jgi:hypothetical protein
VINADKDDDLIDEDPPESAAAGVFEGLLFLFVVGGFVTPLCIGLWRWAVG